MQDAASLPLAAWDNFYVIVGSSAAALTGLLFVVMALIAEAQTASSESTIDTFGTPTIVHFCAALLLSATFSAPWRTLTGPAAVLGICGVAGVAYVGLIVRRAKRQTAYKPVFEDWLWHAILPFVAYGALMVAAFAMVRTTTDSLFCIAAVALLLLFIGIHNAWDTVIYITLMRVPRPSGEEKTS
jgi:hypothetical protein